MKPSPTHFSARRLLLGALALTVGASLLPAQTQKATSEWTPLLDPSLSKWELWMGVPHTSVTGLPEGTPQADKPDAGKPLGLNNDPKHVFSVIEENGQPVLKITGEIYGGLTTLAEYENYHFSCQVKWGPKKWAPRLELKRDTGLLYHCTGKHGAFWNVWMRCVEFQVLEGEMADLYMLAGTGGDVRIRELPTVGQYDPKGAFDPSKPFVSIGRVQRSANFESPFGEWNTLEIYTLGRKSVHLVNGHVVLAIDNIREKSRAGGDDFVPLSKGKIQIQSEGAEVYYRDIKIKPISDFPESVWKDSGHVK